MTKPEGISQEAYYRVLQKASDLRVSIFDITSKAAAVWGEEGVIEAMNEAFVSAILSAVEEEREEILEMIAGYGATWAAESIAMNIRNRKES